MRVDVEKEGKGVERGKEGARRVAREERGRQDGEPGVKEWNRTRMDVRKEGR